MRRISFSEFIPEIKLAIGEVQDDIVANYVRQAIIDLCERSQILRRTVTLDVQCGVEDYPIEVDEDERIVSIQRICVGNQECMRPTVLRVTEPCDTGCTLHSHTIWFVPPDTLNIRPAPIQDRHNAIKVVVAVAPTRDACTADSVFYERYHETVINGALARLYLAKTTPWFEPNLAQYHKALYDQGVAAAGMDRLTGNKRGRIQMTPRRII